MMNMAFLIPWCLWRTCTISQLSFSSSFSWLLSYLPTTTSKFTQYATRASFTTLSNRTSGKNCAEKSRKRRKKFWSRTRHGSKNWPSLNLKAMQAKQLLILLAAGKEVRTSPSGIPPPILWGTLKWQKTLQTGSPVDQVIDSLLQWIFGKFESNEKVMMSSVLICWAQGNLVISGFVYPSLSH